MINKKTWKEFHDSSLLWWVNRSLHLFGWAIVIEVEENGDVTNAYPARVGFRGFSEEVETNGFIGLTEYLNKESENLLKEAKE